jgi:hypothetical protein
MGPCPGALASASCRPWNATGVSRKTYWSKVWSTNRLERVNKEIKRRSHGRDLPHPRRRDPPRRRGPRRHPRRMAVADHRRCMSERSMAEQRSRDRGRGVGFPVLTRQRRLIIVPKIDASNALANSYSSHSAEVPSFPVGSSVPSSAPRLPARSDETVSAPLGTASDPCPTAETSPTVAIRSSASSGVAIGRWQPLRRPTPVVRRP